MRRALGHPAPCVKQFVINEASCCQMPPEWERISNFWLLTSDLLSSHFEVMFYWMDTVMNWNHMHNMVHLDFFLVCFRMINI
jgi:hypothetical protein